MAARLQGCWALSENILRLANRCKSWLILINVVS
jgi:hypothetical protein